MSDNSFYFSHDYSASMDIKVEAMVGDFGAAGYGLFWTIVEMLHSESEHKLPLKKLTYMAISKRMSTPIEDVERFVQKCINDYELFVSDDEYFYSKRVFTNISKRNEIREKRSESGKLGGRPKSKIKQTESICLANESKGKESKEKEIKGNINTVLDNNNETISEETDTLSLDCQLFKDQKLPIGERKTNFKHIVEKLISTKYSKELCEGFFNFWTQIDTKKPNSMKFETQSTWNTSLRLATWKRNDEKGVYKKPMAQQQSEQPQENELFEIYRGVRISKKLTPEARQKEIDRIDMVKKLAI